MPVKTDNAGRRSVQVEVEVPGTPEQVWQAIATETIEDDKEAVYKKLDSVVGEAFESYPPNKK